MIYNFANLLKSFKAPACAIMKKIKYVELDARLSCFVMMLLFDSLLVLWIKFFIIKLHSQNESPVGNVVRQLMTLAGGILSWL
jgi:hypothetical protein